MTARAPITASDAVRVLTELRREKAGWRRTCDEARFKNGNGPEWFELQDDYLAALDFAIGSLAAPEKPAAPTSKPSPTAAPKPAAAKPSVSTMQEAFL